MANFYEDYLEITPDVDLDQASYMLVFGLRILNSKRYFLWNSALIQYRELIEGQCGKQLMSRGNYNYVNQLTEISLFRLLFIWNAFRAPHNNNNLHLGNLWLNKRFIHIDNFIWLYTALRGRHQSSNSKDEEMEAKWCVQGYRTRTIFWLSVSSWIFPSLHSWFSAYAESLE